LTLPSTDICFTTDSYVVKPLFFRGGDIGKLAVCGTVNDLAVSGAVPAALSMALVLEEGREVLLLRRVLESAGRAAERSRADLVLRGHVSQSDGNLLSAGGKPLVKVGGADYVGVVAMKVSGGRITALEYRLELLDQRWNGSTPIRLVGVGMDRVVGREDAVQQELFEDELAKKRKVEEAVTRIREKMDGVNLTKASLLGLNRSWWSVRNAASKTRRRQSSATTAVHPYNSQDRHKQLQQSTVQSVEPPTLLLQSSA
jgi:hypothetical protein